jgi:dTDP-4-amino-4,6-dideoxygalactose transaminase
MDSENKPVVTVPFNDLHAHYLTIKSEIDSAISEVIKTSAFIRGPFVEKFEEQFARLMQTKYCVSCANGTDSLYIAMRALNIKPGDEVIVPSHSWISSSETVTQAGGKIVFCDTKIDTFTIDPAQIESKVTSRTVGIIPVHLFGQSADMDPIMEISNKYNLWVLEDCAQSHLAKYKGKQVGTFGNVASFSFYPGKNLGAMGDAGAITTNDLGLANRMRMIARHGGLSKGEHVMEGINSRLDGLQAAILSVKLPHLHRWTRQRQYLADRYSQMLVGLNEIEVPRVADGMEHVWHLYVIKNKRRDNLASHLNGRGIQTVINYPVALPFLPAYSYLNYLPSDFPNAYLNQSLILSLPIFPEMTVAQIDYVITEINHFFKPVP